jgi:hypothetical protein
VLIVLSPTYFPMSYGGLDSVVGKRGLFMFLVRGAETKHVRRRARFEQHRDASCTQVFFFLQGKAPKVIAAAATWFLRTNF